MPRKSDNILDSLATLPWWASVITASFVYVVMVFLLPAIAGDNPFASSFAQALSPLAPYGFLLFLLPVPFSLFKARRKRQQLDAQQDINSIRDLSWLRFEELVGEAYRRQGYRIIENDSAGPDGGIDLVISRQGKQCKQWRSQKVGVKVVREMFGLVTAERAAGGIVITSGQFTRDASGFADGKSLELVDGEKLAALVGAVQKEPKLTSQEIESKPKIDLGAPPCPTCGGKMVLHVQPGRARKSASSSGAAVDILNVGGQGRITDKLSISWYLTPVFHSGGASRHSVVRICIRLWRERRKSPLFRYQGSSV